MKILIKINERGLLFKDGNYEKCLKARSYFYMPFHKYEVVVMDINKPFIPKGYAIDTFLEDEALLEELDIVNVEHNQLVVHYCEGRLKGVLSTGKYAFWHVHHHNEFQVIDFKKTEIGEDFDKTLLKHSQLRGKYLEVHIAPYEQGILLYDHKMQKTLQPGRYFYWTVFKDVEVRKVDLRKTQVDMVGQEIMTADKVTLRINFVCGYRITNIHKVIMEIQDIYNQIYLFLQLVLREYVGTLKLDDLLRVKHEIGDYVLQRLKEKEGELGIEYLDAGVKDVILPGDIKDILNTVLIAEKKAQAKVITRREEIASTRSLLNTAKLMDENKTLYKLKELEHMEKICDKIGHLSVSGGANMMEMLTEAFIK
ncbi:slipin family protein [Vallitalea pronyensis]|uniref:Slipin family protein n=1 Tax=Vallitalea pronyensis TaxID=1348613 RepID=A0A8J8MJ44_9FIRM|nr:slipin family protein [Vallitalea pronyensis]QUI22772.1 slipin family protein [Vallitalea pronyensis]